MKSGQKEAVNHASSTLSCHGPASDQSQSDHEEIQCCCTVDVISPTLEKVEWHLPNELLPVTLLIAEQHLSDATLSIPSHYLRSESWRAWTLTPELRLGPAIHSMAPPY